MDSKQVQIAMLCDGISETIIIVCITCEVKENVVEPTKYCRSEFLIEVPLECKFNDNFHTP